MFEWTECITMDVKSIEVNIVNADEEAHKELLTLDM
jgi:hypothetical protein